MGTVVTATAFVGIDVAKATLDACLLGPGGRARRAAFANDAAGHAALLAWADRHAAGAALHFCLEATGPYSEAPAAALAQAGRHVSVANPARVKAHAAAGGQGNKTDPADARAIAEFARDRNPPAWQPPSPEVRALQGLVRRVYDLVEMAAREKGRLASPALTKPARRSVRRTLRLLEREADRVRAEVDALVAASPPLRADRVGGGVLRAAERASRWKRSTRLARSGCAGSMWGTFRATVRSRCGSWA